MEKFKQSTNSEISIHGVPTEYINYAYIIYILYIYLVSRIYFDNYPTQIDVEMSPEMSAGSLSVTQPSGPSTLAINTNCL